MFDLCLTLLDWCSCYFEHQHYLIYLCKVNIGCCCCCCCLTVKNGKGQIILLLKAFVAGLAPSFNSIIHQQQMRLGVSTVDSP